MPRTDPIQQSFNGGEFGRQLLARTDFAKYKNGLRKAENVIPLTHGGASRRPGSRYIATVKDSTALTHVMPFVFKTTQAYMIEKGNNYFRFMRNQGTITTVDVTASITNGDFPSGIANWTDKSPGTGAISHDATNDRLSLDANTTPATNFAHAEQQVTNASAIAHILGFRVYGAPGDTIKVRVGTSTGGTQIINDQVVGVGFHITEFTATAADFFVQFIYDALPKSVTIDNVILLDDQPVEIVTPYTTAQVAQLRWVQSTDTLYLFHNDVPTYKLLRLGHASWSLEEIDWGDGPYMDENITTTTLAAGATTGEAVTITASAVNGINDNDGFKSTDVGRPIRLAASDGTIGYGIVVEFTDTTHVKVDVRDAFKDTVATASWKLGVFSGTTGYPATGHFNDQRLVVANTTQDPDKLWFSQSGDFENMRQDSDLTSSSVETQDDDAFDFRISSDQVNPIRWMRSGKQFIIGTQGGEWIASSDGPILKPSDIDIKQHTRMGSANIDPIQVDNAVLFAQRGERRIHEFAFNFEADGFRSPDLTILAPHITQTRIIRTVYAQSPDNAVIAQRTDGRLAVLTYKREQDVVGWARWVLGGTFSSGIAVVESVAVIPGNNGSGQTQDSTERDEIWVVVKRTINSSTVRYIEMFEERFEGTDPNNFLTQALYETQILIDQKDAYYADSLITYDGAASGLTANLTGYTHLIGETVKVLADGAVHPDVVVDSSGEITLEYDASVVQTGLGYFHDIEPLILDVGNPAGSALAKLKKIREVGFLLHETGALTVGADRANLKDKSLREIADLMDTAVPLFSGIFIAEIDGGEVTDPKVIIRADDPTPFTLLASTGDVHTTVP